MTDKEHYDGKMDETTDGGAWRLQQWYRNIRHTKEKVYGTRNGNYVIFISVF